MAFIENDLSVINIKLTNKGREKLSKGQLTFTQYAVGDSEIDYNFIKKVQSIDSNFSGFDFSILRPKDAQPELKSYLIRDSLNTGETRYDLPTITSIPSTITNTTQKRGYFNNNGTEFLTDQKFVKQPDAAVQVTGVTGGTIMKLVKAPSYIGNLTEPELYDYILVKWTNPILNSNTTNFNIDIPVPYLWYKIEDIISGSLGADNLIIEVDKPLPNFNGDGAGLEAQVLVYPKNTYTGSTGNAIENYYGTPFISDFLSDAVFSFRENYDTPTIDVPVWNMSIVFTEEIAGVNSGTSLSIGNYESKIYGGFVQYIQELDTTIKNIGIIHYSNNSPSNNYGEGFVGDTPKLTLPTILWHKNFSGETGLVLSADSTQKFLPQLNIEYRDLVDKNGDVFGKVFLGLKIFVIEDQELLFAMSYKSNRNWTLPQIGTNFNITFCNPCTLDVIGSFDITSAMGEPTGATITMTVLTGAQGTVTYSIDGGNNRQTSNKFTGLSAGTYTVIAYDSGSPNCQDEETFTIDSNNEVILDKFLSGATSTGDLDVNITNSSIISPFSGSSQTIVIFMSGDSNSSLSPAPRYYDAELFSGSTTIAPNPNQSSWALGEEIQFVNVPAGTYQFVVTDNIGNVITSADIILSS
ncbi:MAG: hypothetical protein ACOCVF_01405 [bacterium]